MSEEELKKAKDMFAGKLVLGLESSDELSEFYGFQEILKHKLSTPEEIMKKVSAVSAKDIKKVAGQIFVGEHLNLALIGPWRDASEFESLLRF